MPSTVLLNAKEAAAALGVSRQMLNRYFHAGLPRTPDKRYNLEECQRWLKDQELGKPTTDATSARTELMIAQRVKIELETARVRRELVPAADVRQVLQAIAAVVAGQLEALPPRIAADLEGLPPVEIIHKMRAELHSVRVAIADQVEGLDLGAA